MTDDVVALPATGSVESVAPVTACEVELVRPARISRRDERGMVSAEWAVGIIAAVAVAGVLLAVVTKGPVQDALLQFILQAIHQFSGAFGKLKW